MIAAARARRRYAAPMSMSADVEQQRVAFSNWLRARMEAHRYATTGDRPGGQVRLSGVTGVSQSILSRALAAKSVPTPETVIRLAEALNANVPDALRVGGYEELADFIERTASDQAAGRESDPIASRIESAPELTSVQRPVVLGHYHRRRKEVMDALAEEVDEMIRVIAAATARELAQGSAEQMIARLRELTEGLTAEQRSELESQILKQMGDLLALTEAKAERLRRAS